LEKIHQRMVVVIFEDLEAILYSAGYVSSNLDRSIDSAHVASSKYFKWLTMWWHILFWHNKNKQIRLSLI